MSNEWPTRLRVEMEGANKEEVYSRLYAQARQFFGDEPFRLTGEVEVDVAEETSTIAGKTILTTWTGTAYFEDLR